MVAKEITAEERSALLQRLMAWPGLRRADKLCRLLQLLHENSGAPLSEKEIAARLFPRPAGHDSTDDSIVRVSVRQLRFKLQEYFAGTGGEERWIIEIPKGEYALRFAERVVAQPLEPSVEPVTLPTRSPGRKWLGLTAVFAAGLIGGFLVAKLVPATAPDLPRNLLVRAMGGGKYSLTVVPGDVGLRQLVFLPGGKMPPLSEYLQARPDPAELSPDDVTGRLARWIVSTRVVSGPHTAVVGSLVAATGELRQRATVRHPRDLTVRALQQNSYAFLASRLMNPIVDVFEPKLTLRCDNEGPDLRIGIVDVLARSGERVRYSVQEPRDMMSYARIALLPNLGTDGGRVLLLSGLGAVGTEAAALIASDPAWLRVIEERLPAGQVFFEALVEARSANGMPVDLNVRIVRPVKTELSRR